MRLESFVVVHKRFQKETEPKRNENCSITLIRSHTRAEHSGNADSLLCALQLVYYSIAIHWFITAWYCLCKKKIINLFVHDEQKKYRDQDRDRFRGERRPATGVRRQAVVRVTAHTDDTTIAFNVYWPLGKSSTKTNWEHLTNEMMVRTSTLSYRLHKPHTWTRHILFQLLLFNKTDADNAV